MSLLHTSGVSARGHAASELGELCIDLAMSLHLYD